MLRKYSPPALLFLLLFPRRLQRSFYVRGSSVSILICGMSLSIFNDHPNEAFTSCLPALRFPLLPLEHPTRCLSKNTSAFWVKKNQQKKHCGDIKLEKKMIRYHLCVSTLQMCVSWICVLFFRAPLCVLVRARGPLLRAK